jgi:hypothetical protein
MTNKLRNLILAGIAAVLLIAFFTNPDQAAHLTAIQQIVALRKPDAAAALNNVILPAVVYNDYWVCSTGTVGNGNVTLSYGYLGQVHTTDDIARFLRPPPSN